MPLRKHSGQKFKFAQTYTVTYRTAKEDHQIAQKQWRLLQDLRRVMDGNLAGLRRLLNLFKRAAKAPEHSEVNAHGFRFAMRSHGLRDPILLRRLFAEFSSGPDTIDFRNLIGVLVSVNNEPLEMKLDLLYDTWDADCNGALSFGEIVPYVTFDIPMHQKEVALFNFQRTWRLVARLGLDAVSAEMLDAPAAGSFEATKEVLIDACQTMPSVHSFFYHILTRRPAVAANRHGGALLSTLHSRLRELDAEVAKEFVNWKVSKAPCAENLRQLRPRSVMPKPFG